MWYRNRTVPSGLTPTASPAALPMYTVPTNRCRPFFHGSCRINSTNGIESAVIAIRMRFSPLMRRREAATTRDAQESGQGHGNPDDSPLPCSHGTGD